MMASLNTLPVELQAKIYAECDNQENLSQVNRQFYALSLVPSVHARSLLARYGSSDAVNGSPLSCVVTNCPTKLSTESLECMANIGCDLRADSEFLVRWAAAAGRVDLLRCYVSRCGSEGIANDEFYALRIACQNGHVDAVRYLLPFGGINVNNHQPLRVATQQGHSDIVQLLLAQGADCRVDGDFPLRTSVSNGDLRLVETLLDAGADARAMQDESLVLASYKGHAKIVAKLLASGCAVDARENMPLTAAVRGGHWQLALSLIERGADVHTDGDLALRKSLDAQQWQTAQDLLAIHGANPNANRSSPLWKAACAGRVEIVQTMLDLKVKVNAKPGLATAVMTAKLPRGQTEKVLKLLMSSGLELSVEESILVKEHFPRILIVSSSAPAKLIVPKKLNAKMMTFSLR